MKHALNTIRYFDIHGAQYQDTILKQCIDILPYRYVLQIPSQEHISCWSEHWSLLFNPTKIVQISFKSNLQTSYTIRTSLITKVESHNYKDLHCIGIILSSNLTWDTHYLTISLLKPTVYPGTGS